MSLSEPTTSPAAVRGKIELEQFTLIQLFAHCGHQKIKILDTYYNCALLYIK